MPHAARRLHAWLIFDVGQIMKAYALCVLILVTPDFAAEIKLHGVIAGAKNQLFALSADESAPRWLCIGDEFDGYTLTRYEPQDEKLVLRKADEVRVVFLPQPKARSSKVMQARGSLRGLDRAYELALQGDEEIATMLRALQVLVDANDRIRARLSAFKTTGEEARRAERHIRQMTESEEDMRRRIVEMAVPQKPNKAPEPTTMAVTPRAIEGVSK